MYKFMTWSHSVVLQDVCLVPSEKRPSVMHNDGILQVSLLLLLSISPLQTAVIAVGTLHPPLGIPLSPYTQAGQKLLHRTLMPHKTSLHTFSCIHKPSAVYKTSKSLIVSEDRLLDLAAKHEPQQIKCVELRRALCDTVVVSI